LCVCHVHACRPPLSVRRWVFAPRFSIFPAFSAFPQLNCLFLNQLNHFLRHPFVCVVLPLYLVCSVSAHFLSLFSYVESCVWMSILNIFFWSSNTFGNFSRNPPQNSVLSLCLISGTHLFSLRKSSEESVMKVFRGECHANLREGSVMRLPS